MTLLLTIIISLLVYTLSNSQNVRLIALSIGSIIVYTEFVGIGVFAAILLVIVTLLCKHFIQLKSSKFPTILWGYIVTAILIFIASKYFTPNNISYPVGYSIVMFSGISLLIDEKKNNRSYTFLEAITFLFFFPKILAGPIERIGSFVDQLEPKSKSQLATNIYDGFKVIVLGAFIKYIVADSLSALSSGDYFGINQLISMLIYALQFYCDFWAYSLLAIGFAKLYGINIMYNFNRPYRAASFSDFWKRWNISLSTWLKDYIYIPLQINAKTSRTINIFIVFLVSAFWHGLALPFIIWGVMHAIFSSIEKQKSFVKLTGNKIYSTVVVIICALLWQTFKASNLTELSNEIIRLFSFQTVNITLPSTLTISYLGVYILESKFIHNYIIETKALTDKDIVIEVAIISLMILSLLFFGFNINSPFFYFTY